MARDRLPYRATILLVCALLAVVLVVVIAAGSSSVACSACHQPQASATSASGHASTGCYDCHLDDGLWSLPQHKAAELLVMYPGQVIGSNQKMLGETSRRACLRCHASVLDKVTTASGLRVKHAACATGSSCDPCHATAVHGKATGRLAYSSMEECVACHSQKDVSIECDTCHEGKVEAQSLRAGSWQVIHGSNWEKTHGMGDLQSCGPCHPGGYCAKCHNVEIPHPRSFGSTHGASAIEERASCEVCHEPEPFCDNCHGMPMPHPAGFLKGHGKTAESNDDPRCRRCHAMTDCAACHVGHVHPGGATPPPPPIGANR